MKTVRFFICFALLLSLLLSLNGCSTTDQTELLDPEIIPMEQVATLLPTQLSAQNLAVKDTQACLLKEIPAIQIQKGQGDLIAWSPTKYSLAIVEPQNSSWGWFVGNVILYDPLLDKTDKLTANEAVFGDITWSPDGTQIAYVILDQENSLYSVEIIRLSDQLITEVFSGSEKANTDVWSNLKGIGGWTDAQNLTVSSSCGADCSRIYNFNSASSALSQVNEVRKSEDPSLVPQNKFTSPDGIWRITVDKNDNVWVESTRSQIVSLLLSTTAISEIKWTENSNYFALKTTDSVLIYETVCSKK